MQKLALQRVKIHATTQTLCTAGTKYKHTLDVKLYKYHPKQKETGVGTGTEDTTADTGVHKDTANM